MKNLRTAEDFQTHDQTMTSYPMLPRDRRKNQNVLIMFRGIECVVLYVYAFYAPSAWLHAQAQGQTYLTLI
jgi:hypothetical protein